MTIERLTNVTCLPKKRGSPMIRTAMAATVVVLFLAGCATGNTPITTPNGKRGFIVNCAFSGGDWAQCRLAASSVCSNKFRMLDKVETTTPTAYGLIVSRHVVAECNQ